MLYDGIPAELRDEIYAWLRVNAKDERKPTDTDEQFIYKTRKKALGPFKRAFWDLLGRKSSSNWRDAYDAKFEFLFKQLAVGGYDRHGCAIRAAHPSIIDRRRARPGTGQVDAAPDDLELSD